jgi:CheY-like chemotaxis protein
MSVAYGIISRHKGEILVESEENKGSVFTIKLPVNLEATEKEKTEFLKKSNQKFRILVVDDDDNIRDVLKDLLTLEGHRATLAKNGEQAIQLFDKDKFDMVITDLGMPGLSGWDVAKKIKQTEPDIPVIIISGWGAQLSEEELKQAKVDMILAKPFNLEQIQKVIAKCADKIIKRSRVAVRQDETPT